MTRSNRPTVRSDALVLFKEFVREQRELYLLDEQPDKETPYARHLNDAMAGAGALIAANGSWHNPKTCEA